jgi:hypothetical protein
MAGAVGEAGVVVLDGGDVEEEAEEGTEEEGREEEKEGEKAEAADAAVVAAEKSGRADSAVLVEGKKGTNAVVSWRMRRRSSTERRARNRGGGRG